MANQPTKELTESEVIVQKISDFYHELTALETQRDAEINEKYGDEPWADTSGIDEKYREDIDLIKHDIQLQIEKLYYSSHKDNYFYFDCSSQVYSQHYAIRKEAYFNEVLDATEEDFILSEVKYFSNPRFFRIIELNYVFNFHYDSYIDYGDKYRIPLAKKLQFLDGRLRQFDKALVFEEYESDFDEDGNYCRGYTTIQVLEKSSPKVSKLQAEIEEEIPDPKTEKQLTINQIVLLLQETGFFSHPKIESASKVKQSELISKICGLNSKNIKSKIQNLDKNLKELGENHQKDMDKIEAILDKLE